MAAAAIVNPAAFAAMATYLFDSVALFSKVVSRLLTTRR
jgi:hypothetical protein